jgi:hypothetical protein
VTEWLTGQEAWRETAGTVVTTWSLNGPFAGDDLKHDLRLVAQPRGCSLAVAREPGTWVVVDRLDARVQGVDPCRRGVRPDHEDRDYAGYAGRP